jgi:hypothetical protein
MPQPKIRPNPQDETQDRHKPCAAQYGGQSERCDQQHQHGCTTGDKGHAGIGQQKQAEWLFQIPGALHFPFSGIEIWSSMASLAQCAAGPKPMTKAWPAFHSQGTVLCNICINGPDYTCCQGTAAKVSSTAP